MKIAHVAGAGLLGLIGTMLFPLPAHALTPQEWENRIQYQINKKRANAGLNDLIDGSCVDGFAERHVSYLENNDLLKHQSMENISNQCNALSAGENIARGFTEPIDVVNAWMTSSTHRAVILNGAYDRLGVGAQRDEDGTWYVVADFLNE